MFDRFIIVAAAAAVIVQTSVAIVFFGGLTAITLASFSVISGPF